MQVGWGEELLQLVVGELADEGLQALRLWSRGERTFEQVGEVELVAGAGSSAVPAVIPDSAQNCRQASSILFSTCRSAAISRG